MKCLIKIALFTILITCLAAMMIPESGDAPKLKGQVSETTTTSFIELINEVRIKETVEPLMFSKLLSDGAEKRACELQKSGQWSHDGYVEAFKAAGYDHYAVIGENLARNFSSDQEILNGWLNSPTHAKNVYSSRFQDIGIGKCNGYVILWLGREQ